jgi:hypothetical protein
MRATIISIEGPGVQIEGGRLHRCFIAFRAARFFDVAITRLVGVYYSNSRLPHHPPPARIV